MREEDVEAVHEPHRRRRSTISSRQPQRAARAAAARPDDGRLALPPLVQHRPRRRLGGRGRARDRRLRAGARARGHLGPVAADRAARTLQSAGVGRALLRARARVRATARAAGSSCPRRTRARCAPTPGSGWTLHPCFCATRRAARTCARPTGSAPATRADIPFTAEVDRHVRGAAHGAGHRARCWRWATTLLIAPEPRLRRRRATAVACGCWRPRDDEAARRAAARRARPRRGRGHASSCDHRPSSSGRSASCSKRGSSLRPTRAPMFLGGDVGPFTPYLPSGAFL